jgi:hypothetical protein
MMVYIGPAGKLSGQKKPGPFGPGFSFYSVTDYLVTVIFLVAIWLSAITFTV